MLPPVPVDGRCLGSEIGQGVAGLGLASTVRRVCVVTYGADHTVALVLLWDFVSWSAGRGTSRPRLLIRLHVLAGGREAGRGGVRVSGGGVAVGCEVSVERRVRRGG
ncbi:hypothetical protein Ssi03_73170 [Sphaerisporangium siamense]|nr:hypothetical protein Ssi03_73170 [Sphaerisporangium siamense]